MSGITQAECAGECALKRKLCGVHSLIALQNKAKVIKPSTEVTYSLMDVANAAILINRSNSSKPGCKQDGCKKRKLKKLEVCVEHSRPSRCLVSKCALDVKKGAGICEDHFKKETNEIKPKPINPEKPACTIYSCSADPLKQKEFCKKHIMRKRCLADDCTKIAHSKGLCKSHGGVKRCKIEGCKTGARGRTGLCTAHGGGVRCSEDNCNNGAIGKSLKCRRHGGGKRCSVEDCDSAASGATKLCKFHGGGKRCVAENCDKAAHNKDFCYKHFRIAGFSPLAKKICNEQGCLKKAFRKFEECKEHSKRIETK